VAITANAKAPTSGIVFVFIFCVLVWPVFEIDCPLGEGGRSKFFMMANVEALATRYRERHVDTGLRFEVRKVISTRVE